MLSGISVVCFASSYAVALLLEFSRFFFRSKIRAAVMLLFAGLGLFTHTVFLYYQAVHAAGYPLSNKQDWYFLAAWVLAAVYLYLSHYHPKTPFGVFILPIVLGLIGAGRFWADPAPFAHQPALAAWSILHGTALLLATVAIAVGFVSGVMYLEQAHRLKRKLPPRRWLPLPSLEWLGRVNGRSVGFSLILLALGIISGMVLNSIHHGDPGHRISLADPLVFGTLAMFVWLLVSAGTSFLYRPAREGHKVAYLTVLSFAFLLVVLGLGLFLGIRHGQTSPDDREAFQPIPRVWIWFKKGSDTVVRSTRPTFGRCPAVPATVPVPFLTHIQTWRHPAGSLLKEATEVAKTVPPDISPRLGGMA